MTTDAGLAAQALSAAGDAIVTVDVQGRITSWNQAAESMLGHSAAEAVGQTLALLVPPAYRSRHIAAFRAAMDSGKLAHEGRPARVEALVVDGEDQPLVMSLGLLLGPGGTPVGAVAVLRRASDPDSFV